MATLTRKTEVTKIITVTLGKIQESKHAKCGLNLRKSLLVASVLHKARNIYVAEVKNRAMANDNSNSGANNDKKTDSAPSGGSPTVVIVPATARRFSPQRSMSVIEEEQSSQESSDIEMNPTLTKTAQSCNSFTQLKNTSSTTSVRPSFNNTSFVEDSDSPHSVVDDILDDLATASEEECTTAGKENNPPEVKQQVQPVVSSCGRCLKRRASTDYPESDNDNNNHSTYQSDQFYVPMKRSRSISVDSSVCESLEDTSKPLPMDTTQINSLVSIFSQSFPEFTSTDPHDSSSVYETSTEMNTFALCRDSIALTA